MKHFHLALLVVGLMLLASIAVAQPVETAPTPAPDVLTTLIGILTPLVVYAGTAVAKWLMPKLTPVLIVSIVVPVLAGAVTLITQLAGGGGAWYVQMGLGLIAVFVHELVTNLKPAAPPA